MVGVEATGADERLVLSDTEHFVLDQMAQSPVLPLRQAKQVKALLQAATGASTHQVSQQHQVSIEALHLWEGRFLTRGLAGVGMAYPPPSGSTASAHRSTSVHKLSEEKRFELVLRARMASGDYPGVQRLYSDTPDRLHPAGERAVGEEIEALIEARQFAEIDQLLDLTGAVTSDSPIFMSSALASCCAQDDWEGAGALMGAAEGILRDTGDPDLRLAMFRFLCLSLQLERAEAFLAEWGAAAKADEDVLPLVAAMYVALGEHKKVLTLFEGQVEQGRRVDHALLLDAVASAVRHTGEYGRIFELLSRSFAQDESLHTRNLIDRLLAEGSLAVFAGGLEVLPEQLTGSEIVSPLYAFRTAQLSETLAGPPTATGNRTIYFCTDHRYLLGTCVALSSLLRNNPGISRRHPVFVICDDEVIEEASAIIAEIAETFGAVIPVRASSSVIDHGDMQFKTGWGLFTLGHTLSDAAYFRVFAAKALIEAGVTGRALYLDSDICVGPGVASLLEFDLEGHPIGARPEIALGSILNAAVKLNLDPATYFNSGVLLFDLEHPDLPSLLERTIDISLHEHERLTFVDQCALNLAFEGRAVMLPPEFNRYLRQHEHVTAEMEEPVVWHFLARPKPWDPMYRSINAMRWISELKVLGQFLSPDRLRRLVAIQFTDARRVEGDFEDKAGLSQVSPG